MNGQRLLDLRNGILTILTIAQQETSGPHMVMFICGLQGSQWLEPNFGINFSTWHA
jgi:hypothetical protein